MNVVAPRVRISRAVGSALPLVLTALLALLVTLAIQFLRLDGDSKYLGYLVRIALPIALAAFFAFRAVLADLRSLADAGLLISRWRAHIWESALIYAGLAWVSVQLSSCPCYPDLVILGATALLVIIGTLVGALIATATFRPRDDS